MQTLNAFVAPPFAAIFWVGLLWKRTNGAGAMTAIVGGLALGGAIKAAGALWQMPGWYYPFSNQAGFCWLVCIGLCVLGTLLRPGVTPGASRDVVTLWDSADALSEGLGKRWYSSVFLWGGLLLALTFAAMAYFSSLFFPVA